MSVIPIIGIIASQEKFIQITKPTITEVGVSDTSISFRITNNSDVGTYFYYEIGDTIPDQYSVYIPGNSQTSTLSITGLSASTTYVLYAYGKKTGYIDSPVDSESFTTNPINTTTTAPSITNIVSAEDLFNPGFYYLLWRVYNNHGDTVTAYSEIDDSNCDLNIGTIAAGSYVTRSAYNLVRRQTGKIYAKAQASGKSMSTIVSENYTVL